MTPIPSTTSSHDTGVYPSRTHLFLDDHHVARLNGLWRLPGPR